jgi:hypothetical protein
LRLRSLALACGFAGWRRLVEAWNMERERCLDCRL